MQGESDKKRSKQERAKTRVDYRNKFDSIFGFKVKLRCKRKGQEEKHPILYSCKYKSTQNNSILYILISA